MLVVMKVKEGSTLECCFLGEKRLLLSYELEVNFELDLATCSLSVFSYLR